MDCEPGNTLFCYAVLARAHDSVQLPIKKREFISTELEQ